MPTRPPLLPRSSESPGRDRVNLKWASVPLATGLVAACIFLGECHRRPHSFPIALLTPTVVAGVALNSDRVSTTTLYAHPVVSSSADALMEDQVLDGQTVRSSVAYKQALVQMSQSPQWNSVDTALELTSLAAAHSETAPADMQTSIRNGVAASVPDHEHLRTAIMTMGASSMLAKKDEKKDDKKEDACDCCHKSKCGCCGGDLYDASIHNTGMPYSSFQAT